MESEYLAARQEWDDRFAGQRKSVKVLTGITVLSLSIGLLGLGYGVWTGARTQYIPYVVQVDQLGRSEIAAEPKRLGDWPPAVIKRELELFFDRFRTVSPDASIIVKNHSALEKFLPSGAPATHKIRTFFNSPENNPLKRAVRETVSFELVSVNFVSGQTWRVEWIETAYARQSGRAHATTRYVATTQVEFRRPKSREIIQDNPLGLFLVDVDVQEIKS